MRVLLLAKYQNLGASSRVRFLQYLDFLNANGVSVNIQPLFSNSYVRSIYTGKFRRWHAVRGYFSRFLFLLRGGSYDVIIIEKELFPFLPHSIERFFLPKDTYTIVDYDDAVFHRYDKNKSWVIRKIFGNKIDAVMKSANAVMCGNSYLASRAINSGNSNVNVVPTAVDTSRYVGGQEERKSSELVVGWIGSPGTSRYLQPLLYIFERAAQNLDVRFIAIGAKKEDFLGTVVEVVDWSEQTEIESLKSLDVGIMPLPDSPWERGKCGYKLIQYMACGKPVIASPVGVNIDIVKHGENGYLAPDEEAWFFFIKKFCEMSSFNREEMGARGRELVERSYSVTSQAPRILRLLQNQ
ncbi:MAG: glycosyl transferase family 1 [Halomonas sp.]|nr:glycosyl transferase family 1 [Halomonas sp.]